MKSSIQSRWGSLVVLLLLGLFANPSMAANDDAAAYYGNNGNADDDYVDLSYQDFDQISLMPVSCVN
jgi:hypothetical protein